MNHTSPRDQALVTLLLEKPATERTALLEILCGSDPALRQRVEALLAAHETVQGETIPSNTKPSIQFDLPDSPDELIGANIGRYKLREKLGEGGCGVVYVAEQEQPVRRRVALKVIKLGMDTKQVVARFEAERQALAMMDHPNIAKVLDGGTTESGRPFFVMELVRGIRITDYCDQNNLGTRERLDLFIQVCHAIQHAHQKGIIHRDIKPSNILVTLHDGVPVPKVIDFGIAKATEGRLTEVTVYTQLHQFIGTPAYMSPEQAEMSGLDIDTRSDIYSLGVLLYELLTGQTPFDAKELIDSGIDAMRKTIREKEPVRPSTRLAGLQGEEQTTTAKRRGAEAPKLIHLLRGDLDWVVMKCLEKDRTRRYETANGIAADLKRHLTNEPVVARPPSTAYRLQKAWRRNKLVFASASMVVVALVAGIGVSLWQAIRARRAENVQSGLYEEANRARANEVKQRRLAESNAKQAEENEFQSRSLLYAADMNSAQQSLQANNLGRARRLLDRYRPNAQSSIRNRKSDTDIRGWEWRYLWQQSRGNAWATLGKRDHGAASLSIAPDNHTLAVGYFDGRIELWDIPGRRLIKVLVDKSTAPARVAFSPNSDLLAATGVPGGAGVVKLYNLATSKESILYDLQETEIRDLSFSNDGALVTILGFSVTNSPVLIVNAREDRLVTSNSITASFGSFFNNARLSPDHQRLYLSQGDFTQPKLQCVRLSDWQVLWEQEGQDNGFTAMDLSPDGRYLVTGTGFEFSTVQVWDARTGKPGNELAGHSGWISQLAFSRDGLVLASASSDQSIRLWNTTTWEEYATPFRGHGDEVWGVAFSPEGHLLATGSKDGEVMLWDARGKQPGGTRQSLAKSVKFASVLPGGQSILAETTNGAWSVIDLSTLRETRLSISSWNFSTFRPPNYLGTHDGTNFFRLYEVTNSGERLLQEMSVGPASSADFAYFPEKRLLAWNGGSQTIRIASLDEPAKRTVLTNEIPLSPVTFGGDGRFLLAASKPSDQRVRTALVWNWSADKVVARKHFSDQQLAEFLPGTNAILVVFPTHETIEISDLASPEHPPFNMHQPGALFGLAFSPDKRTIAVCSGSGAVVLYDALRPEKGSTLHGHLNAVMGGAFSPDGRRFASAFGGSEAVKLWDLGTRQELLTLKGRGTMLGSVGFTDDGNTLLIGSTYQPGFYQFWRAPSWAEINQVERNGPAWPRAKE